MSSKENKSNKIFLVLAILFALIFLGCVIWIISYFIGLHKAEKEMESIMSEFVQDGGTDAFVLPESSEESVTSSETTDSSEESTEVVESSETVNLADYGVTDRVIDFEALHNEVNGDIYSWIIVPGTVIDYPVLQHPTEMDYYLEYNLNGTKGYPGCIYTQRYNGKEWEDPNTVLYGHNMKNGTMFAGLHRFKDKKFFDENQYIYIYTEDGRILVYQIFAAYEYPDTHLLLSGQLFTEDGRQTYFDSIRTNEGMNNNFNMDVELNSESKIITLSTCISNKPTMRYLVQGVLITEGTQSNE